MRQDESCLVLYVLKLFCNCKESLLKGEQELEGDPPLFGGGQEGSRADAVVEAVLHELPHEEPGTVGKLKHFIL